MGATKSPTPLLGFLYKYNVTITKYISVNYKDLKIYGEFLCDEKRNRKFISINERLDQA